MYCLLCPDSLDGSFSDCDNFPDHSTVGHGQTTLDGSLNDCEIIADKQLRQNIAGRFVYTFCIRFPF